MISEDYNERPHCEQILDRMQSWAINPSEFHFKKVFNNLTEIDENNRSYIQNIIVSKLSIIIETFWLYF